MTKLRAELDEPNALSKGRSTDSRAAAIVEVETGVDITGIGEGYAPNPHIVETVVERTFAETLVDEDPLDVDSEGRVAVPTDPGLGVELTDDLVAASGTE